MGGLDAAISIFVIPDLIRDLFSAPYLA